MVTPKTGAKHELLFNKPASFDDSGQLACLKVIKLFQGDLASLHRAGQRQNIMINEVAYSTQPTVLKTDFTNINILNDLTFRAEYGEKTVQKLNLRIDTIISDLVPIL